jgi:hypothetical protein
MLKKMVLVWNFSVAMEFGQVKQLTYHEQYKSGYSNCILNLGHVPHDGLPESDIATVYVPVAVIFILLDVCGLAFALVCLVFNVLFRDKK